MKSKFDFSDAAHRKRCKQAGCKHPAIYKMPGSTVLGWCALCREVAFFPKPPKKKAELPEYVS